MVNSTIEELVLYMYNELDNNHEEEIGGELENNWVLREKYNVLKESAQRLSNMHLQSPRQQTIDAILKYASSPHKLSSR